MKIFPDAAAAKACCTRAGGASADTWGDALIYMRKQHKALVYALQAIG